MTFPEFCRQLVRLLYIQYSQLQTTIHKNNT